MDKIMFTKTATPAWLLRALRAFSRQATKYGRQSLAGKIPFPKCGGSAWIELRRNRVAS